MLKVAINGFGRIGRCVLRAYLDDLCDDIEIVAINDNADSQTLLHLLQFDSTYGRLAQTAWLNDGQLVVSQNNKTISIQLFGESNPANLAWSKLGVDVVLECTGQFREYDKANWHRKAGAKQVIIGAAPFDRVDGSIVVGVNDVCLSRDLPIISGVSCTTQALVPLLFVLDNAFGLDSAMMTEIHALTADQMVLDKAHRDLRRARACAFNIIPTTSSSIAATVRVLPKLANKINGLSIRVPTITVAAIDVSANFRHQATTQDIKTVLQQASDNMPKIIGYSNQPLVSSDFIKDSRSLIVDEEQIMVVGKQAKVFAWYDNEWGYANRLLDMLKILAKQ